jgi:hypothetical protein
MYKYLAILLVFISFSSYAEINMDCSLDEVKNIAKSPTKAKRLASHILRVNTAHTHLIFKDKPPYDDGFPTLRWEYCGYNSALKMHLVHKDEDTVFSGVLIDDITAKQIPAGQDVLFSDDEQLYAAFVQPDGLDGRELSIYTRDGIVLWHGYDFIEAQKDHILATFDEGYLHWNKKNQLQGVAVCVTGKKFGLVTLTDQGDGEWTWLPNVHCEL